MRSDLVTAEVGIPCGEKVEVMAHGHSCSVLHHNDHENKIKYKLHWGVGAM